MTPPTHLTTLGHLVTAREREQERLGAELSRQQSVRERMQRSVDRLHALCEAAGPSGSQPFLLAANCAAFKQSVMGLAQEQQRSLERHSAEVEVARAALHAAFRKREGVAQVLHKRESEWRLAGEVRARKQLDDVALTVWRRTER